MEGHTQKKNTIGASLDMKGDIIKQINTAFIDMVSCSIYKADIPRAFNRLHNYHDCRLCRFKFAILI